MKQNEIAEMAAEEAAEKEKMKETVDNVDIEIDSADIAEGEIAEIAEREIAETAEKKIVDIVEKKIADIAERKTAEIAEIAERFVAESKTVVEIDLTDFLHQMKFFLKRSALTQLLHFSYSFFYYSCRQ